MPTPVSTARQCLTPDAAVALDAAAAVARRRVHAQTTSLHAVSALLSLPSSSLREACSRARNGAYSGRVQFKALELCLGVSLDRLPAARGTEEEEEPPVSNSLMAAIKRSQANQRRQPESFHMYQQQQQHSSSVSMVKVELQNLVLSILDDPVVSRVFGEAGFRSCDIKLAILRPLHQLLKYSHYRGPPMFLCNLTDDNFRRIGEVLMRPKGRNPFLVGGCANDALHNFCKAIERRKAGSIFPVEIYDVNVIHMESDFTKFGNEELVKKRYREVALMVEHCTGPGTIINYGDVKEFTRDEEPIATLSCVIDELTKLLELYCGKVWLIGAAATYEIYLKFLNRFPFVEKEWDLQLLPITSLRPAVGEPQPKSSLMESFVPFGGFFSATSDFSFPFVELNQCPSRCHLCNEKCEQEIFSVAKRGFTASVAEQFHSGLPTWLQIMEQSTKWPSQTAKATDEGMTLSAKVKVVQRKWDNICQRLHNTSQLTRANLYQPSSQVPPIGVHKNSDDMKKNTRHSISDETNESSNISDCGNTSLPPNKPLSGILMEGDTNFVSQIKGKTSKSPHLDLNELGSLTEGHASPPSATSVAEDIGLQTHSPPPNGRLKQSMNQSLLCARSNSHSYFHQSDFKIIYGVLSEKISWQEEAVDTISQAIARRRMANQKCSGTSTRGDIWFSFLGPDSFSKKKIAVALVDILFGSRGSFIRVDLNSHEQGSNGFDMKFRGRNIVDHVAWELSRKPFSVVFLENIDKADLMVQNSLSQALRTGKFPDSHGREVSINNTVFVTTSRFIKSDKILYFAEETSKYSVEGIFRAKKRPIEMAIRCIEKSVGNSDPVVLNTSETISYPYIVNKRKIIGNSEIAKRAHKDSKMHLDLNLLPDEIEVHDMDNEFEFISENTRVWFEKLVISVDETVVFKPLDIKIFTEKITKKIDECFHSILGSDCVLEVDSIVMEQILAAVYLSEKNEVEDWLKQVLCLGFIEAQKRYNVTSASIVKLSTCGGLNSEGKKLGLCLPPRIVVE